MAAKPYVEILGENELYRNLNASISRMKLKTPTALLAAAEYVLEQAEEGIPRDRGFLANSAFAEALPNTGGDDFGVIFGYEKEYAAYVHEMPADTNWKKPQAESQWLLKTLQREQNAILEVIRDQARADLDNPFNKRG